MATNSFFTQGTTGEQDLVGNLVVEQIKMFGKDVYYIPRTLVKNDSVFGEDTLSQFNGAFLIEAYIEDASGFRGDGDMFSKFGVRISDQVTFIISRTRFTEAVDDNAQLIVEGRPNEGDLIHFPLANKTFEIQFVEHEVPFYQLGKVHVWGLRCELFEYSDEDFDTGVAAVDAIEVDFSNAVTVNFAAGGSGDFTVGEIVAGGTSNVTAEVKSWDSSTRQLQVYNRSGIFTIPETVTGQTSSAAWTTASYNTINNVNSEFDQNFALETVADGVIDFTESNPFGEFGNKGTTI
ncbi:neck protein [Cyanophage P-TIM40]|uniref:Neck protein n=1 Tax=Cyanophage P-TIM40 TaxID=1589733 RepID=A0A0C5AAX8_9CAUD|nr:head closure Hc2 [Cyanophage P-TIM40]AJK27536.1 neck protein [Cyanophage P-TIM40]